MNANNTRFQLLLGYEDWAKCLYEGLYPLRTAWEASPPASVKTDLAWDYVRAELTLQPRLFQFASALRNTAPTLANRRGAGRDRFSNWYWLSETGREILVNSAGSGLTTHFWAAGDGVACERDGQGEDFEAKEPLAPLVLDLSGLTVTDDHYLVVGVLEPPGLLIFDLHAGGPPRQFLWPVPGNFTPFDLAPMPGGGVWILDRSHRVYWGLDCHWQIMGETGAVGEVTEAFQPQEGGPTRLETAGLPVTSGWSLAAFDPIALEALPDATVLILDRDPASNYSRIYRYREGQAIGSAVSTEAMEALIERENRPPEGYNLRGYDFAFVAEHRTPEGKLVPDRMYIAAENGDQTFSFELYLGGDQLKLQPLSDYLPMRLFGGKGLVAAGYEAYYDFADRWIPLKIQPRPRFAPEADLYTPLSEPGRVLDGHAPDCVWDRLLLDASLPPGSRIAVWSRAANDLRELAVAPWQPEPRPYLRHDGSEQPYAPRYVGKGGGTWELIFQRATGRYLQLRLQLSGNGQNTPRLRAIRAYYPRFSYLEHYLPSLYQEDSQSASFLDRFLANIEGFYTTLEDRIAAVQMLFDVRSAPPETLEWLAGWFGVALDPAWDEPRQRLFIRHAMEFFEYRGTIRGLQMALQLALAECVDEALFNLDGQDKRKKRPDNTIRIIEQYRLRRTPGLLLGDPTAPQGPQLAEQTLRWQPAQGGEELHRRYRQFLDPELSGDSLDVRYPVQRPANAIVATYWQQFSQATLGFVPTTRSSDLTRWQNFLRRRYQSIEAFNAAYGLGAAQSLGALEEVALPERLPPDGAPLQDWFQFEGVVLTTPVRAHRFTVLLPVPKLSDQEADRYQQRLELAERIIRLEKPVHTTFDIKFYWTAFRVGEARLGSDTLLDRGSRTHLTMSAMVLGQGFLAASYLAPSPPQNVADRAVLGRDRLSR